MFLFSSVSFYLFANIFPKTDKLLTLSDIPYTYYMSNAYNMSKMLFYRINMYKKSKKLYIYKKHV